MILKKKSIIFSLKLAMSVGGLVFALKLSNFNAEFILINFKLPYILCAIFSLTVSYFFSAIRTTIIFKLAKQKLGLKQSLISCFIGSWFNQFLPSNIGGDVVRAYYVKGDLSFVKTIFILFIDRLLGLLISMFLVIGFFFYFNNFQLNGLSTLFIFISLVIIFSFILKFTFFKKRVIPVIKSLSSIDFLIIICTSVFAHFFNILCYVFVFLSFDIKLNHYVLLILVPVISYISSVPISIGGWGVRETTTILLFRDYEIYGFEAMTISLTYGLLVFICSLPGLFLFFIAKRNSPS